MGKYLLAIDCGLTNCKMVLFDTNGERIGLQSFRTPLQDIWLDLAAIREKITYGIRELLDQTQVSVENIAAIGLSGHGNGAYFICREQKDDFAVSSMFSGGSVSDHRSDQLERSAAFCDIVDQKNSSTSA